MNRLRAGVAGVITVVWAVGYIWSYVDPDVKAPAEATPIMLAVAAYLYAREIARKVKDEPKNGR